VHYPISGSINTTFNMLRLAVRTFVPKLQPPSKLTYKHGLSRLSRFRPFRVSTRAYSEACDHSEANLEAKITGLETEVKDFKIGMTGLETEVKDVKTEVKDFKTEMKDFRTEIFHKFDILGTKFESSQKEMAHKFEILGTKFESGQKEMASKFENKLSSVSNDQQKQFSNFYARSFFGIVGIAAILIGSAWILPMKETERLDAEVKKRAIIRDGADKMLRGS